MGFTIEFSQDSENIILLEKRGPQMAEALVLILDIYSLRIKNEMIISIRDPDFSNFEYPESADVNYDDMESHYPTSNRLQKIVCWSKAR